MTKGMRNSDEDPGWLRTGGLYNGDMNYFHNSNLIDPYSNVPGAQMTLVLIEKDLHLEG